MWPRQGTCGYAMICFPWTKKGLVVFATCVGARHAQRRGGEQRERVHYAKPYAIPMLIIILIMVKHITNNNNNNNNNNNKLNVITYYCIVIAMLNSNSINRMRNVVERTVAGVGGVLRRRDFPSWCRGWFPCMR